MDEARAGEQPSSHEPDVHHGEGNPQDDLASALQAADERLANGLPPAEECPVDIASSHPELNRAIDVLRLLHQVSSRDSQHASGAEKERDGDVDQADETNRVLPVDGDSEEEDALDRFANYEILERIAKGGMGVVFRARDIDLNRTVALKVMLAGPLALEEERRRFRGEAEAAASLDHPGIVPVYEVGEYRGQLFFTMGLVEGESLADRVRENPLPARDAAEIARQIAEAVAYAHARGIIHRDIKPANVLIDNQGRARVTDFGLARRVDSVSELTGTGQVLGTPSYIAPEQAAGKTELVGPPSDVYSIGATLYCLLTGRAPFSAGTPVETLRLVMDREPVSLRQINPDLPADLTTICAKCLEKDPSSRYASAAAVQADLQRFLNGEPVEARRPSRIQRAVRTCRRYPLATFNGVLLLAAAILGPILALNQRQLYRDAEQARQDVNRALYVSDMNIAMSDWESANIERCGELLNRHVPEVGETDLRGFEWYYLWRKWNASDQTPVAFEDERLESMAVSPDGRLLAAGCFDGALVLWDLEQQREVRRWKAHPYRTVFLSFSFDGSMLASASIDDEVALWDVNTGDEIRKMEGARCVAFSPVDHKLAYRSGDFAFTILKDARGDEEIRIEDAHDFYIGGLAFSPDAERLVSVGWDQKIWLWNANTGEKLADVGTHAHSVWSVAWSDDGKRLATGDVHGKIGLWDMEQLAPMTTWLAHGSTVNALAFAPGGQSLASASSDNTVRRWAIPTASPVQVLQGHFADVNSLSFSPSGDRLYSASIDGRVKSWNVSGELVTDQLTHDDSVGTVAFLPDTRRLVSGSRDGKLHIWDVATGTMESRWQAHSRNIWRVRVTTLDDRPAIVSVGGDGAVRLWDADTQNMIRELPCFESPDGVMPVATSPDQKWIAYRDTRFTAVIHDLARNELVHQLTVGSCEDLVFSQDRSRLYVAADHTLGAYDVESGDELELITGDPRRIHFLAMAPDAQMLASANYDRTVKLWRLGERSGSQIFQLEDSLRGHSGPAWTISFAPDQSLIASAGEDLLIRLWDPATGQQRATLSGHLADIVSIAFSPDGEILASASDDHTVRLWRAPKTSR